MKKNKEKTQQEFFLDENLNLQKKKKKKKIHYKRILTLISIIAISTFLLSNDWINTTREVIVTGNKYVSTDLILEQTHLNQHTHFLFFNSDQAEKKLKEDNRLKSVKITKHWFNKIKVTVSERRVLCYSEDLKYKYLENYKQYDTGDGYHQDAPTLIGKIPSDQLKTLLVELNKMDGSLLSLISEIEYFENKVQDQKFKFYMRDGNTVYIYEDSLADKFSYYPSMLNTLEGKKGIIEFFEFEMRSSFTPY